MGEWKKPTTFTLDRTHHDLIAAVGRVLEPASQNQSFNLRALLDVFATFLTNERMPCWVARLQAVWSVKVCEGVGETGLPETPEMALGLAGQGYVAGKKGRSLGEGFGGSAKRSPRIVPSPKERAARAAWVRIDVHSLPLATSFAAPRRMLLGA